MKTIALIGLLALATPAHAADKALILTEDEQAVLRHVLDTATKAEGLSIAQNTLYLLNKLNAAPVVTPHKDEPPKPEEPKQ